MRWVRAIALIVIGLLLMGAGVGELLQQGPPPPPREPGFIRELSPSDAAEADRAQREELRRVCEQTGRFHEWPCNQVRPAAG